MLQKYASFSSGLTKIEMKLLASRRDKLPIEALSLFYMSARAHPGGHPVFRTDVPHKTGGHLYYHINTIGQDVIDDALYQPANVMQNQMFTKTDHMKISENAYKVLRRFDKVVKVVRVVGKVLLVTGIVLDVLELGMAIEADLNDADEKLGRKTVETVASIGGRWGGAIAGAKLGAMGGSAIGTAIMPGVGTAIGGVAGGLILGIAGAIGGSAFAEWIVDITYVGE